MYTVALCDGTTFYILAEEWDLISNSGVTIIDSLIFENENTDVELHDNITPVDKNDLFCLQLDYLPNGNIENQIWQMGWRDIFRYSMSYDALNRLEHATFSEHFIQNGMRKKTTENRFSVSGIDYDGDGNINPLFTTKP